MFYTEAVSLKKSPLDVSSCCVFRINRSYKKWKYVQCVWNRAAFSLFSLSVTPLITSSLDSPHKLTSFVPPSLGLHHHISFTLGLCPPPPHPSFLYCLPSSLLYLPPSTSSLPLHPFLTAAFKKSSHLGILTVFSRQKPAPQRDLNRGEPCDGYLPKTV